MNCKRKSHPAGWDFLQLHENGQADIHGAFGHGAVHGQDPHTRCCGSPERCTEGGVSGIVWVEIFYVRHLDDKQHISAEAPHDQLFQSSQMFGTPLCGRIGESTDTVIFQCHTLDLQIADLAVFDEGKIKPGVAAEAFGFKIFDFSKASRKQPFPGGNVGSLRIHVDQALTFADGDQVVVGLAGRIGIVAAPYRCAGGQQFPAAAGIFYMDRFFLTVDLHFCDKPIGPEEKISRDHIVVFQVFTTFLGPIIPLFRKKCKRNVIQG